MPSEERPHPFVPIRINLTEQKEWDKRFSMSDSASDAAYADFHHMTAQTTESLIDELWSARPAKGRATKTKLTYEQISFLSEKLSENNEHLEPARQTITDALTWMYEAAASPTDSDIEEAMEKAAEDIIENDDISADLWTLVLSDEDLASSPSWKYRAGPKEWSPRKKYTGQEIFKQLLEKVSLIHEKDHYDRYLEFDFWNTRAAQELFTQHKGSPEIYYRMNLEFKWLAKRYTEKTLYELVKIMKDVNISNRTNWRSTWKGMLKDGIEPHVREGMMEVLKEMPDA